MVCVLLTVRCTIVNRSRRSRHMDEGSGSNKTNEPGGKGIPSKKGGEKKESQCLPDLPRPKICTNRRVISGTHTIHMDGIRTAGSADLKNVLPFRWTTRRGVCRPGSHHRLIHGSCFHKMMIFVTAGYGWVVAMMDHGESRAKSIGNQMSEKCE